jgi:hypothetical protein
MARIPYARLASRASVAAAIAAVIVVLLLALSAVHLLPQLRSPFTQTTTVRSEPVLLRSITALSRYEAASGSFQVVVAVTRHTSFIPSFLAGSQTLFIGQGSVVAFVDFSQLSGSAVQVSKDRSSVRLTVPPARLEPAVLDVHQSYVFAEQQGLLTRVGNFFSGDPNGQQQAYIAAQQKIQAAASGSPLVADAEQNTRQMLSGMLGALGFRHISIGFGTR